VLTVLFIVIGAVLVFVIAAVAIGRVTSNLAVAPERAVYDPDQSLEFVAEALPSDVTAELSYDEVQRVLRLFHDYLHAQGVATTAGDSERHRQPAVIDPDEAVDYVVERASRAGIVVRRRDAQAVIDAQMAYFEAIGALGGPVDEPDDPLA
jgi:hypothetical protein